jgi:hypothetical protein
VTAPPPAEDVDAAQEQAPAEAPAPPPPIPSTGDPASDEDLALMRLCTEGIHLRQDEVEDLSKERMRTVLRLRERGVLFSVIAEAVPTTEQTVYKIARAARRAKEAGEL